MNKSVNYNNYKIQSVLEYFRDFKNYFSFEKWEESRVTPAIKISELGFVYSFAQKTNEGVKIKYIGKAKGKYLINRMNNHFKNNSNSTQSKNSFIEGLTEDNKVYIALISTNPISLRNMIEEDIIDELRKDPKEDLWNFKKENKSE